MLKYYLSLFLLFYLIQIFSQNSLIASQGFEESGDNWAIEVISTPPCTEQDDTWNYHTALAEILPADGSFFWGIQDLNGNCGSSGYEYIELEAYNISNFRNVTLSFNYIVKGYDNGDDMMYELWFDGESQEEILFVDGKNDLSYENWTAISIDIPNTVSIIKIRISIKQNGSDTGGIDQIELRGRPLNSCSELMISEYTEGSSSLTHRNNYIEIYNPKDVSTDLNEYKLVKYTGKNIQPSGSLQLKGFLEPYGTYLIEDDTETLQVAADLSTNSTVMDFNGDDKIALQKNTEIIDVLGSIGDSINFGKDITLRRKSSVKNSNNEFDINEWESYGLEETGGLGFHASYCQGNLPEIEINGKGLEIVDGSTQSSLNNNTYFGAWPVSIDTTIQQSFVIKNIGNKVLSIDQITISGSDAFHLSKGFETHQSIEVSDSLVFTIAFMPKEIGLHTASIEILNSDPSKNPFEFMIQGEGTGPTAHPLLISQYYEGEANNKWIEITNISGKSSPENTYYIALFRNEATRQPIGIKPSSKKLIPAIEPGQSIKYSATLQVTAPAYAIDDQQIRSAVCSFTGDDILVISTSGAESCWIDRKDIIGLSGNWGTNLSMIRKYGCNASTPNTGFQESDWLIYPYEDIDNAAPGSNQRIGIHHSGTTTWTDESWTNGKPDPYRKAIIASDYSTDTNGNLEVCSLQILKDISLSIQASDYVSIQNDLFVDGVLNISDEGSLIMTEDLGSIENTGSILVQKATTPLKPYDYTYWSSPVKNAILENVFLNSPRSSFHFFSAKNFEDADQDGLDDNNDAWVRISGGMEVGRGYTSMAPDTTPFINIQHVTFSGVVNNGLIETPLQTQQSTTSNAHHWNLIGNPYPSAIDAEILQNLPENKGLISGTFYFWTHSTPAVLDNSSDTRAYTANDYAMYTVGTGGIKVNPDSKVPTRYISSCQGFFTEALKEGTLVFKNEIRTVIGNDNFYKSKNSKDSSYQNKVWINLSNKQGAFSQILIGFVEGATTGFDPDFDGRRIHTQNPVNFYSLSSDQPLAIQGLPKLKGDERIRLGIEHKMMSSSLFEISLDQITGEISNSALILYDKLLHKKHNLSHGPYAFVLAQSGKFDNRFELHFNQEIVDMSPLSEESSKIIWQHLEESLLVKTNNLDTIRRIEVFDLNGRKLKDQLVNDQLAKINWFGFPSRGIYVLRLRLEDSRTLVTKLIP